MTTCLEGVGRVPRPGRQLHPVRCMIPAHLNMSINWQHMTRILAALAHMHGTCIAGQADMLQSMRVTCSTDATLMLHGRPWSHLTAEATHGRYAGQHVSRFDCRQAQQPEDTTCV